ncbi:MAG: hypothetical protein V7784_11205 [Oceanospirillaceae bacterium]
MNELMELQTGQVAFISSLMAGFSLSIAVQIIRLRRSDVLSNCSFLLFTLSALLFLVALYIDVALSLRTAGFSNINEDTLQNIVQIRNIGTSAATSAFFLFVMSIALVGWLQSKTTGIITTLVAVFTLAVLIYARATIFNLVL